MRRRALVLLAALAALAPVAAAATTVLPLDLAALTTTADRIFVGRVLDVRAGEDGHGLPATWTRFAVTDALKGALGSEVRLKQFGVDTPDAAGRLQRAPALPRYRAGEEVVLFLHADSAVGFSSPVGLGQGCFRIRRDGATALAANDLGNANLAPAERRTLPEAAAAPAPGAPVALDELLAKIRRLRDAAPGTP